QLLELGFVLARVVSAEQQLAAGRKHGANLGGRSAAVATVEGGQGGAGECRWGHEGLPPSVPASAMPARNAVCVTSTVADEFRRASVPRKLGRWSRAGIGEGLPTCSFRPDHHPAIRVFSHVRHHAQGEAHTGRTPRVAGPSTGAVRCQRNFHVRRSGEGGLAVRRRISVRRCLGAAIVLLAWRRPPRAAWRGRSLVLAGTFGTVTAGMNVVFYEAIARLPLGTAVAIEFAGPVTVAAVGSRRLRDVGALLLV